MGEFNSDEHYIHYCGQESLRRNRAALIENKSLKCSTWMQSQKWQNDLGSLLRQTINITVIQGYVPTSNAEEAKVEQFYEDLQDLLELTHKEDVLFIILHWNAKVGSQKTPGITSKFGLRVQNEAGKRLTEFCQENTLVIANTLFQQHKRICSRVFRLCRHYQMVSIEIRLIIFFLAKDGEALYSQQKQDWELTVAQIMNSLLPNSDLNWRK